MSVPAVHRDILVSGIKYYVTVGMYGQKTERSRSLSPDPSPSVNQRSVLDCLPPCSHPGNVPINEMCAHCEDQGSMLMKFKLLGGFKALTVVYCGPRISQQELSISKPQKIEG